MTDEELVKRMRSQIGDDVQCIYDHEALFRVAVWSDSEELKLANDRIKGLEAALRAWTETIATVMPADFKDWHQNSPDEWPLVTVRVIKSLQEQLDLFLDQSVTVGMEQLRAAFDAGCENGWDHARWESVYDPQPLGCEDAFNKFLAALDLTPAPDAAIREAALKLVQLYDSAMDDLLGEDVHRTHPDSDEMAEIRRILGAPDAR